MKLLSEANLLVIDTYQDTGFTVSVLTHFNCGCYIILLCHRFADFILLLKLKLRRNVQSELTNVYSLIFLKFLEFFILYTIKSHTNCGKIAMAAFWEIKMFPALSLSHHRAHPIALLYCYTSTFLLTSFCSFVYLVQGYIIFNNWETSKNSSLWIMYFSV